MIFTPFKPHPSCSSWLLPSNPPQSTSSFHLWISQRLPILHFQKKKNPIWRVFDLFVFFLYLVVLIFHSIHIVQCFRLTTPPPPPKKILFIPTQIWLCQISWRLNKEKKTYVWWRWASGQKCLLSLASTTKLIVKQLCDAHLVLTFRSDNSESTSPYRGRQTALS